MELTLYQILCLVGVPTLISGLIGWILAKFGTVKALKLGVQSLLQDRLLQAHRYYMKKGTMSFTERQVITNMYTQYHGLGQNGIMDDYYKQMMNLPTEQGE